MNNNIFQWSWFRFWACLIEFWLMVTMLSARKIELVEYCAIADKQRFSWPSFTPPLWNSIEILQFNYDFETRSRHFTHKKGGKKPNNRTLIELNCSNEMSSFEIFPIRIEANTNIGFSSRRMLLHFFQGSSESESEALRHVFPSILSHVILVFFSCEFRILPTYIRIGCIEISEKRFKTKRNGKETKERKRERKWIGLDWICGSEKLNIVNTFFL